MDFIDRLLPTSGGRVSSYELHEELGRGGFGIVFRARTEGLDADVAIKFMIPQSTERTTNRDLYQRFVQEAEIMKRLEHPSAIKVRDFGETDDGLPFLVSEFIRGQCLDEVLVEGPMALGRAAHIVEQILGCLTEAHGLGIVHRDLKPQNIMVRDIADERDSVKVLDFGVARLREGSDVQTRTGAFVGTPWYMAPEQAQGDKTLDGRADLYSVGLILAEMLTGQRLVRADKPMAALFLQSRPEPLDIPEVLRRSPLFPIVKRATEKDRDRRFDSASQMRTALRGLCDALGPASLRQVVPMVDPLRPTEPDLPIPTAPTLPTDSRHYDDDDSETAVDERAPATDSGTIAPHTLVDKDTDRQIADGPPPQTSASDGAARVRRVAITAVVLLVMSGLSWTLLRPDEPTPPDDGSPIASPIPSPIESQCYIGVDDFDRELYGSRTIDLPQTYLSRVYDRGSEEIVERFYESTGDEWEVRLTLDGPETFLVTGDGIDGFGTFEGKGLSWTSAEWQSDLLPNFIRRTTYSHEDGLLVLSTATHGRGSEMAVVSTVRYAELDCEDYHQALEAAVASGPQLVVIPGSPIISSTPPLRDLFNARRPELYQCYEDLNDPSLSFSAIVEFTVVPGGRVTDVSFLGHDDPSVLFDCLTSVVEGWEFPDYVDGLTTLSAEIQFGGEGTGSGEDAEIEFVEEGTGSDESEF